MTEWHQRKWVNRLLLGLISCVILALVLLGNWQMRRLAWKTDLIQAVETRAYGAPSDFGTSADWPPLSRKTHEYLRVQLDGQFVPGHQIQVKALTELGGGYWVLDPFRIADGTIVWVNRGFVPTAQRRSVNLPDEPEPVTLTGLLRMSEPKGTALQSNDPDVGRWVSRDVAAFSLARGLPDPAPFFVDADHMGVSAGWPRGGLTKLVFRNNHLQYALTWYAMALLLAIGTGYLIRLARRSRRQKTG